MHHVYLNNDQNHFENLSAHIPGDFEFMEFEEIFLVSSIEMIFEVFFQTHTPFNSVVGVLIF